MEYGTYARPAAPQHRVKRTVCWECEPMIARGDLFSACLDPVVGSEQGGVRPVLVIQNDVGNRYSPTVIDADRKGLSPYDCSPDALDEIRAIKAAIDAKE